MRPFRVETGVLVPLLRANVDTDQIIPKQFLKSIARTGFGPSLFFDWRFHPDGTERPEFVLNQAPYREGRVLVAGANFGCGSSREHAVWSLQQFGFRAVIAPSFADIFRNNAIKMGLLPVVLRAEACSRLGELAESRPGVEATVDLEHQTVACAGVDFEFTADPFERHCLLEGLDDIGLTLREEAAITEFERHRPSWMPDLRREPQVASTLRLAPR